MHAWWGRVFGRVLLVHIGVVTIFLLLSFLKGCFKPRPKPDIVTYFTLGEVDEKRKPVELAPLPDPVLDSVQDPTPIKKKPSWKPTPVDEIRKGKRVTSAPAMSKMDASTIEKALAELKPNVESSDPFAAYYKEVMRLLYARWSPPTRVEGGSSVPVVRFEVQASGRILTRTLVEGSGVKAYDESVMQAVASVSQLPRLPEGYPYSYVEVVFTIE